MVPDVEKLGPNVDKSVRVIRSPDWQKPKASAALIGSTPYAITPLTGVFFKKTSYRNSEFKTFSGEAKSSGNSFI